MKPEFTAYKLSPHARVACVDCHMGAGTDLVGSLETVRRTSSLRHRVQHISAASVFAGLAAFSGSRAWCVACDPVPQQLMPPPRLIMTMNSTIAAMESIVCQCMFFSSMQSSFALLIAADSVEDGLVSCLSEVFHAQSGAHLPMLLLPLP
jgi:hypothetical protein